MAARNLVKLSRRALIGGGAAAVAVGGSAYALRSNARMQRHAIADPKTLNRGNGAEPNTLDPHLAVTAWENNIIGDMFMGLMTEDAAARPIPGAAERYSASEDGLTYTFKLRPHTWSDGRAGDGAGFRLFLPPRADARNRRAICHNPVSDRECRGGQHRQTAAAETGACARSTITRSKSASVSRCPISRNCWRIRRALRCPGM